MAEGPLVRLAITAVDYRLQQAGPAGWADLAVLPGGAHALLGPALRVDEQQLEAAIAIAEDWLMPHAGTLRGRALDVDDRSGRLRAGLHAVLQHDSPAWTTECLERLFLRMVDLATGRHAPDGLQRHAAAMADLLLLRELAHHGGLERMRLAQAPGA